ncbi:hypothetical protein SO802_005346 [Lithocarpus litseifolius]|uniref:Uncharacterized protein n=1 Tax=Lithocarpus litseifolius TaxID=425828 RepID=A0AAW2DKZ3_9ROSI
MASSKNVRKRLEEVEMARVLAEKARDLAEQDEYDLGVAETEEALRAERVENVFYSLAILESIPSGSKTDSEVAKMGKDTLANVLPSSNKLTERAEHLEVIEKEKDAAQGVAPDAIKPSTATQGPPTEKEVSQKMEIVRPPFLSLPRWLTQ